MEAYSTVQTQVRKWKFVSLFNLSFTGFKPKYESADISFVKSLVYYVFKNNNGLKYIKIIICIAQTSRGLSEYKEDTLKQCSCLILFSYELFPSAEI